MVNRGLVGGQEVKKNPTYLGDASDDDDQDIPEHKPDDKPAGDGEEQAAGDGGNKTPGNKPAGNAEEDATPASVSAGPRTFLTPTKPDGTSSADGADALMKLSIERYTVIIVDKDMKIDELTKENMQLKEELSNLKNPEYNYAMFPKNGATAFAFALECLSGSVNNALHGSTGPGVAPGVAPGIAPEPATTAGRAELKPFKKVARMSIDAPKRGRGRGKGRPKTARMSIDAPKRGPGRPRKNPLPDTVIDLADESGSDDEPGDGSGSHDEPEPEPVPKRKPGRPPKTPKPTDDGTGAATPAKRGPGRPPKIPKPQKPGQSSDPSSEGSSDADDDTDDEPEFNKKHKLSNLKSYSYEIFTPDYDKVINVTGAPDMNWFRKNTKTRTIEQDGPQLEMNDANISEFDNMSFALTFREIKDACRKMNLYDWYNPESSALYKFTGIVKNYDTAKDVFTGTALISWIPNGAPMNLSGLEFSRHLVLKQVKEDKKQA